MKKIVYFLLFISSLGFSQTGNPAPFYNNISLPNATEVTTVANIPVYDSSTGFIENYITFANLKAALNHQGYFDSGTRASNLVTIIGDHDDTSNGTKIKTR